MRDFMEQLNDLIAPQTRAYSDPEIQSLSIGSDNIAEDGQSAVITLTIRVQRTPNKHLFEHNNYTCWCCDHSKQCDDCGFVK